MKPRIFGFSLVELLVVLAIMAVLASVAMPLAQLTRQREQEVELRMALRELRSALDAYKRAVDEGRIESRMGTSGYPPTLEVLAEGVPDRRSAGGARIHFLRRIPADPFFEATSFGSDQNASPASHTAGAKTWGLRSYASSPQHPKAGADVYDVYSRSERVGLDGRRYKDW